MNTTYRPEPRRPELVYGARPDGRSTFQERWVTISRDDGCYTITSYTGWLIDTQISMTGGSADLADAVAAQLWKDMIR